MLSLEKKIELATWLCENNHSIALTGSMMLYLRWIKKPGNSLENFYLGREPQDLDFIVNTQEFFEDEINLTLPPFIEGLEEQDSEFDCYPILKRFYIDGTKVEFIEMPHFRYTWETIPKYGDKGFKFEDIRQSIERLRHGEGDIRLALITDLYAAKAKYIEEDENKEYIEKTKKDLLVLTPILHEVYFDEYKKIIESYLENSWYDYKKYEDIGRKLSESLIKKFIVDGNPDKEKWFEYIRKINHDYLNQYRTWYRNTKDRFYDSYGYTYQMKKTIDKLLYAFEIPFEFSEVQNMELFLV